MSITIKVKDINYVFKDGNSSTWKSLLRDCPTISKIFVDSSYPYTVQYEDQRLRKAMSEIDRIYSSQRGVLDVVGELAMNIRGILHMSMSKKKNLEVRCCWK